MRKLNLAIVLVAIFLFVGCEYQAKGEGQISGKLSFENTIENELGVLAKILLVSDKGQAVMSAKTDEHGNFVFNKVPAQLNYTLALPHYDKLLYYSGENKLMSQTPSYFLLKKDAKKNLNIKFARGLDIKGEFFYTDTSPVAKNNLAVVLYKGDGSKILNYQKQQVASFADDNGKFAFKYLPVGEYKIGVRQYFKEYFYKDDSSTTQNIDDAKKLNLASESLKLKIIIDRGADITGTFKRQGEIVQGAFIFLGQEQGESINSVFITTDKNGKFVFKDVPPGDYYLFIRKDNKSFYYTGENSQLSDKVADAKKMTITADDAGTTKNIAFND